MKSTFITGNMRLPRFIPIPMEMLEQELGSTTLIVYGVLLNRALISQKNQLVDQEGKVFIIYPIHHIARDIGKGESAVKRSLKCLEEHGFILRKQIGFAKPNRIYVKVPENRPNESAKANSKTGQNWASKYTGLNIPYSNEYTCGEGESF